MPHRLAIAPFAGVMLYALVACAGQVTPGAATPGAATPASSPGAPASGPETSQLPTVPAATPTLPAPTPAVPAATPRPDSGNVDEPPAGPMLSIEPVGAQAIRATLEDPAAKAWQIVVAGTGPLIEDRMVITVETGDVSPLIRVSEIQGGQVMSVMDWSGFGDPTTAAGRCHATLGVCVDTDSFRLPRNGDGRLVVTLARSAGAVPLTVTGATAGWPGEPFVLGPWTATDAFPWDSDASG